jgi:hypothetical protein
MLIREEWHYCSIYSKQHENTAWKKNTLINVISHAGQAGESSRRINCSVFLFAGELGQIGP